MANVKSWTFATPSFDGQVAPTSEEIMEWAATDYAIVGFVAPDGDQTKKHFVGYVATSTAKGETFIEAIRRCLPNRWLHATCFDADGATFTLIEYDERGSRSASTWALRLGPGIRGY
jgi:hypothetical protein